MIGSGDRYPTGPLLNRVCTVLGTGVPGCVALEHKDLRGGDPAVGEAEEEGECGRWGGSGNRQGNGMAAGGGYKLLLSARRKGHWGVVECEDRTGGGGEMPEMWGRGANAGSHCVPV